MADHSYITTAINYTNGPPHIGHAYEAIITDVLARYHRLSGKKVRFVTGADEHGLKIAKTAEANKITPKQLCDNNVKFFKLLLEKLNINHDFYIRTTDDFHKKLAQEIFIKVYQKGDIYLGKYSGWYNQREERFMTELEAKETDYVDPISMQPYQKISEPSYFFCMEKYRDRLIKYIQTHQEFINDENRKKYILKRLEEPLHDLSISRTSFDWGIPVPECKEIPPTKEKHVLYVWFDALLNYFSAQEQETKTGTWSVYGAPIQIIGQDIIWFHAVIWPCMLMSIDCELPKTLLVHGFINDAKGQKMSKSIGNVVDPLELVNKYNADSLRYYLVRAGMYGFGADIKFSEDQLVDLHDSDLANSYGNLVNRVFVLAKKFTQSSVPDVLIDVKDQARLDDKKLLEEVHKFFQEGQISQALNLIMLYVHTINVWLNERAPWKLKDSKERDTVMRCALEKVHFISVLLSPFVPTLAQLALNCYDCEDHHINEQIKVNTKIDGSKFSFKALKPKKIK